jgi:mRNA-degrading endonuclease HigB of HigAB toxin-antitoxin module
VKHHYHWPGKHHVRRLIWSAILSGISLIAAGTTAAPATAVAAPPSQLVAVAGQVLNARVLSSANGATVPIPSGLHPVAGARVTVVFSSGKTALARTNKSGHFTVARPAGISVRAVALVSVSAIAFGTWRESGVPVGLPHRNYSILTVLLNGSKHAQDYPRGPAITGNTAAGADLSLRGAAHVSGLGRAAAKSSRQGADAPATAGCSGYYSSAEPPGTILVDNVSTGAVQTYDFEYYVKNVLPNEWVPSWGAASLEAGAMAVKTYGWYWVNDWRGGALGGSCYDVQGGNNSDGSCDVSYQCFRPGSELAATDAAVDDTWGQVALKSGGVFEASYNSGASSDTCGEDDGSPPSRAEMSQWGTEACSRAGDGWQQIFSAYFFPGVTFPAVDYAAPVVGANPSNDQQYVFWRGSNGDLYEAYYKSGSWNGPQDMDAVFGFGNNIASAPSAAVSADGNEYVFWRGTNGDIYEAYYNSASGSWGHQDLTSAQGWGTTTSAVSVGVNSSNDQQYVFWRGSNGDLDEAYYKSGGWSGPQDMDSVFGFGNNIASAPSVAVSSDGNEYVYWRGAQGNIYEAYYTASSGAWNSQDMTNAQTWGDATSAINVGVNSSNDQQYVFWRGSNGDLYEAYYKSGSWNGPQDMDSVFGFGNNIASAPSVAVANDGNEYVFWRGTNDDIYEADYGTSWNHFDMTTSKGWTQ